VFGHGHFCGICLTAETGFEIIKCISDVDMPAHRCMGSKFANFQVFQFWVRPRWNVNILIFRRRASRVTVNTLMKSNYASVRQSRDSLYRDRHNGPEKKVAAVPCSESAGAKKLKKCTDMCFVAHYYACKFGVN